MMEKKEFVQKFMLENFDYSLRLEDQINKAIKVFDMIEERFRQVPTKNLWDYNDMQR